MNINADSIKILCCGDSNTWGADPHVEAPRYPVNVRWTGQLQQRLGEKFEVVEEGLCGRTTVFDDSKEDGRNGKTYLKPCLETHNPIDLVVLMLGTNDLKERFNLSAEQIAKNAEKLVIIIKQFGFTENNLLPKIIFVSPPLVNEIIQIPMEGMIGAEGKSKEFSKFYQEVAERQKCEFIDIAEYIQPSAIDGCHLEKDAHTKIAEVLERKILSGFALQDDEEN